MKTSERLLTAEEVAELLSIRVATVYDAASDGRLPVVKLWQGKRRSLVRFRQEDIERLIQEKSSNQVGTRGSGNPAA